MADNVRPLDTGGFGAFRDGLMVGGGQTEEDARSLLGQDGPSEGPASGEENPFAEFPMVESDVETQPTEDFSEFPLAEPSGAQKAQAVVQGATGGFLETAPILAGMTAGAGIGTVGGPLAPITVPLGAAAGGLAGFFAGREFRRGASQVETPSGTPFTFEKTEDLPPQLRPFGVGGEVFGGSIPFASAPLAAARAGAKLPPSKVGNFINRIIDMAGKAPGSFAAAEAGGATGAGVAGATAEAFRPGETDVRLAAELAGGFFNPIGLFTGLARGSVATMRNAMQSMTRSGRETRAAQVLQDVLREAGEDPEVVAALLKDAGLPGTGQTVAQKTGSPGLAAIEAKLRRESAKFGADSERMGRESLEAISDMIAALRGTGDPQALAAAAELRGRYFRTLLAGRVQIAEREAAEAAANISRDTPAAREALSKQAREALEQALEESRKAETELWNKVPKDIDARADNFLMQFDEIRDELLPEESLPAIVEGFARRMRGEPEPGGLPPDVQRLIDETFGPAAQRRQNTPLGETTSGELIRFRSRALALAREAIAQGKVNDARIYGLLAESALDDLSVLGGTELDAARAFSHELNDVFTRTFAGAALAQGRRGDRVPPEILLRRALASGKEAGALQMQELEQATRFMAREGVTTQNVETMLDAQERILALAAADAVNASTGRISTARLATFLRDNETLMNRFPEVRDRIQAAIQSETDLQDIQRLATNATRQIQRNAAFAKIAKLENPVDAISRAISGPSPVQDIKAFARLAKRGGPQAVNGLKSAILDHALNRSQGDLGRLRTVLFDPVAPNQPSLADLMLESGITKKADMASIRNLIDAGERITSVMNAGREMEALAQEPDALVDLAIRILGAKAGSMSVAGDASGSSLVAAGAGSRFLRNAFNRIPQARVRDVLIEAMMDPEFAAMLLTKPTSASEQIGLLRRIHAYAFSAGLTSDEENDE